MIQVLIAVRDDSDRDTIVKHLPHECRSITIEQWSSTSHKPDICIVDLVRWDDAFHRIQQQRARQIYLLLLVGEDELDELPDRVQNYIDDVLTLPLKPKELQIRIRNLLQMREYSNQLRHIYEKLATTNKALESTSDAIIISDNEGVAVYVNPSFVKLFGYNINEINVGGIPEVLFEKHTLGTEIFHKVNLEGTWKGEVDLQTKSGEVLPFLLNVDRIMDDNNSAIGYITICTDITLHKMVSTIQEEQRIQAEAQLDAAKALTSTLDQNEVFERILSSIYRVVPNDAANIIIIQNDRIRLIDRDNYWDREESRRLRKGDEILEEYDDLKTMLQTGQPLVISNTSKYRVNHPEVRHSPWLQSHIGIPIRLQDEIIGFLNVDSVRPGLLTQAHAERLQIFAEQAAIAIHNARLHEQAKQLAMMEERQRLARNLHDAVSQTLFSASIIAEALPQLWQRDPDAVMPRLEQIQNLARGALASMRTLLLELHPERLMETEIRILLEQLCDAMLGQTHLDVTLSVMEKLALSTDVKSAIYYITQELLNNVVKHAEADEVTVHLNEEEGQCLLVVTDNGCGFDPQEIASTSLGLNIIRERAQSIDADLTIASEIGKGTQTSVKWSN